MDALMGLKGFREFYQSHTGYICDKWEQYIGIYDAELRAILARGQPVRMLEIGVQNGGSLQLWANALPAGSEVTGIDIDPACANLALPANARVLIGDATDEAFLEAALGDHTFDLIIDDGSHRSSDIIRSFALLFPRLRSGGKFIIEDLHASYWAGFGGGFRTPDSAIEFLKSLIDALHADHFEASAAIEPAERVRLAALNQEIARVSFVDSLAVIEKYLEAKTQPFVRTLAGSYIDGTNAEWRRHLTDWSGPLIVLDDATRARLDADRQAAISDLRAQLASAGEPVEAPRPRGAAAERALQDGETARQALANALKAETDAHAATRGRLVAAASTQQALQQSLDALGQSRDALRRSYDALSQSHDDIRRRLKAIKRSWSWRLAWPARRLERLIRRALGR